MIRGVAADVFVPLAMQQALGGDPLEERGNRGLMLIGRLRDDVSIEEARARLAVIAGQHFTDYPGVWSNVRGEGRTVSVLAERDSRLMPQISTPVTAFLAVLMTVVLLVLALACSNVAGLLLARSSARRRELAIRMAVGATERHVMTAVVGGALRLTLIGAGLGLAAAFGVTRFLGFLLYGVSPLDPITFAGMVIVLAAVGVAAAAVPARRAARVDPFEALRAE